MSEGSGVRAHCPACDYETLLFEGNGDVYKSSIWAGEGDELKANYDCPECELAQLQLQNNA